MNLFSFASRTERNIQIGIDAQMWAVASLQNHHAMAARTTKALRYFRVGARGLLYCNPRHAFTTPFTVRSEADPCAVVTDIWPEPWVLPFEIETLGNLSKCIGAEEARTRWPFLAARMDRTRNGGVSAAMNITGTTVFVPVEIDPTDWDTICRDLAV